MATKLHPIHSPWISPCSNTQSKRTRSTVHEDVSYSAAHVSCVSRTRVLAHAHACTRASTREYSHTHTRVLARVHASTRKRTRSRSNACTRFTRSGHASLVPKPSTFFRGGRGLGIDAIDTRLRVLRALITRAHTRVTLAYARILTCE